MTDVLITEKATTQTLEKTVASKPAEEPKQPLGQAEEQIIQAIQALDQSEPNPDQVLADIASQQLEGEKTANRKGFDMTALRESFGIATLVDADTKAAEINNARREVVDAFLKNNSQEIRVDEYGQTLEQIEDRLAILQEGLSSQFTRQRSNAINALAANGIQDPERVLSFYELQKFAADKYLFEKRGNSPGYNLDQRTIEDFYRNLSNTADPWRIKRGDTEEGNQLIEQFKIIEKNPQMLSRENLDKFVQLTGGHLDRYSFDFVISNLDQLSQIYPQRFNDVLQLVKERHTLLWPGNLLDDERVQKVEFIRQLMQRSDLQPQELQVLDAIQSSSRFINDVFRIHPLIKTLTPDELFANAARFEDELTVLEQVIFELNSQNPRFNREKEIKEFLYYFQSFGSRRIFDRLGFLAEKQALHPLVRALNSGWRLNDNLSIFNPEKRVDMDRFIQDINNAQPIEALQENVDAETAGLTSFLRDTYKANNGGVETSRQVDHINALLNPQHRPIIKELISLANTLGDNPKQRRELLTKFFSDFYSGGGFKFDKVTEVLRNNPSEGKFSDGEKEFWQFWRRLAGNYGGKNRAVRYFLLHNRDKFETYVQDGGYFGEVTKGLTPRFLQDSLKYIDSQERDIKKTQFQAELDPRKEFFDVFLNDQFCSPEMSLLVRELGWGRGSHANYQNEKFSDEVVSFLSTNIDTFFQNGIPQWSMFINHFVEEYPNRVRDLLAKQYVGENNIFASLPKTEQEFWTEFWKIPESMYSAILRQIPERNAEAIKKIGVLVDIHTKIQSSPSKEIRNFQEQIVSLLAAEADPVGTYQKIESVFVLNNLPEVGKIYRVFEILHPRGTIDKKIGDRKANRKNGLAQLSPTLSEASTLRKYDIIYRDLLKVHIDSANPSLYRYLSTLKAGQALVDKAELEGYESLDPRTEIPQLTRFLNRMDTLYSNSLYGRRRQQTFDRENSLSERVEDVRKSFGLKDGESMTDRVARMFVKPLGYENIDQVIERMEQVKLTADERNRKYFEESIRNNGGKLKIDAGDLLKGVKSEYLEVFFQNGSVAKEYLGPDASSDSTPFDTDISKVLPKHITDFYSDIFDNSLAESYGDLIFVFRNRNQFQETEGERFTQGKYELFYSGYHGARHYGIRTGIASTEIDAIVVKNELKDMAGQERLFFDIAQSGFYIPVSDKNGKILFTPQDYDRYRLGKDQVYDQIDNPEFSPSSLLELYKKSPYLKRLYDSDVGVHEKYTLEQHTEMMMGQFEKYFAGAWSSPLLDRNKIRIVLSVHDLGKPLSVQVTGSTKAQHEYTLKFVPQIFETFGFSQKEAEIATAVIDQDYLGEYIKGAATVEQTARLIQNKAIELGIPIKDFTELLRIYYMSDAGSYTADAGGQASLDRLFVFNHENGASEMHFAPDTQKNFNQLLQHVYQS